MYANDDVIHPQILVVIEPLLIDEDYYARVEGREIISNLAKAAGLATMISTMRPDIDNMDEYVRNTTARAFAVVASALGIPSLLPFLKAVCHSKKSWQARHTGREEGGREGGWGEREGGGKEEREGGGRGRREREGEGERGGGGGEGGEGRRCGDGP